MTGYDRDYFNTARERERIRLRREAGERPPWTQDWVFAEWRFCNVRREDDKVTRWFRENVRGPLSSFPVASVLATAIFRAFNRIETGEVLVDMLLDLPDVRWSRKEAELRLRAAAERGPVFTGSYMVWSPPGQDKISGILDGLDRFIAEDYPRRTAECESLREAHELLKTARGLSGFTAYELVTDLRWTSALDGAPDILTWAHLGPGATRGLGRVLHGDPAHWQQSSRRDQEEMLEAAAELLALSRAPLPVPLDGLNWPADWPDWEMREVEHWACEYDKYLRVFLGERSRLKNRYRPLEAARRERE